jgi:osmotically-inducible protein OsmY
MKKYSSFVLAAWMAAAFVGCSNEDANKTAANAVNKVESAVNKAETAVNRAISNVNVSTGTNANHNANSNSKTVTREEYEKDKDTFARRAHETGSKIGSGAEDLWLWTKIRADLLAATDLNGGNISVDVENAGATLRGSVPDGKQKIEAEKIAKNVTGVKGVKNQLSVAKINANTR